jgi:hypothetical protein
VSSYEDHHMRAGRFRGRFHRGADSQRLSGLTRLLCFSVDLISRRHHVNSPEQRLSLQMS